MNMKRIWIIISVLATVVFFGYLIINAINMTNVKRAYNEHYIKSSYRMQNKAFFGWEEGQYVDYDSIYEGTLQIHINVYTRKTGKAITLKDVKMFLAKEQNPDGSPRTWEDDTGVIFEFVDWCADNALAINDYSSNMQGVLTRYCVENPEFLYYSLNDLDAVQINELDKKLDDPNYELDLENLK